MATKKHPHAAKTQAADTGEEGWVTDDPKLGEEYYLLDNGIPVPIPDVRTFHPMELSVNPAVALQTPSYMIDDTQPLTKSPRSTPLLMLPDLTQEDRVQAYHEASDLHAAQLQAQIDQAQAGLDAMDGVSDPPAPEPPDPEQQPEPITLPQAAVEAQEAEGEGPAGKARAKEVHNEPPGTVRITDSLPEPVRDLEPESESEPEARGETRGEKAPEPDAEPEPGFPPPKSSSQSSASESSEDGYEARTKAELQQELEARGLSTSGNKDELISRLEENDAETPTSDNPPTGGRGGGPTAAEGLQVTDLEVHLTTPEDEPKE